MFIITTNSGDYQAMLQLGSTPQFRNMFEEEEIAEDIDDGMKYGPCREDLGELWEGSSQVDWERVAAGDKEETWKLKSMSLRKEKKRKLQKSKKRKRKQQKGKLSKEARVARLKHVMEQLGQRLHKKDLTIWKQSCGRFVSQKLGPVIYLRKKGFIRKLKQGEVRKDLLDLRKAGGQGWWVAIPQKKMPKKVVEMVELAELQGSSWKKKKCPTTVAEMEAAQLCPPRMYYITGR